jgi:hypothetical protein
MDLKTIKVGSLLCHVPQSVRRARLRLAAAGARVIVPYLRGYGPTRLLSADTPRPGEQAALASDLLAPLDALAIPKAGGQWIRLGRSRLLHPVGALAVVPVPQTPGRLIAYATAQGKTASDIGDSGGPYAKALAAEILKPGVEAVTMFRNVQIRVKEDIGQDPWLSFRRRRRPTWRGRQRSRERHRHLPNPLAPLRSSASAVRSRR